MTKIKICGITEIEQAVAAAEAGADYLGLILAPSIRQINPQRVASIVHEVKKMIDSPQMVGVFVNLPANDVNFIAESCHLDWVQLSGDENWGYCRQIKKPVIKTIPVFPNLTASQILYEIEKGYSYFSQEYLKILLDTKVKGAYGGSGKLFDWSLAKQVNLKYPSFVAGGLDINNVVQLISEVRPWGVDVSSGVETKGKKDIEKIRQFVERVKSAG